jgi:prophage regulatory protein
MSTENRNLRLLSYDGLGAKGVTFSTTHLLRLMRAGKFPKPVKIGRRDHWVEAEIDQYITDKLAQRDKASA